MHSPLNLDLIARGSSASRLGHFKLGTQVLVYFIALNVIQ